MTSVSEELVSIQTSWFLTDFRPSAVVITDVAVCAAVNQKYSTLMLEWKELEWRDALKDHANSSNAPPQRKVSG